MGYAERKSVLHTIDATSSAGYLPSEGFLSGRIVSITHSPGTVPFTSNTDILVTIEGTSQTVAQIVKGSTGAWHYCPRQPIHTTTGGSTAVGGDYFVIAGDRLKIQTSTGTTGTSGTFTVVVI